MANCLITFDYSDRTDGRSDRERRREIECVLEKKREKECETNTCCDSYAALQTSQIILSCICIMCIGMATHLDRESTCTVIETNMVILFGAYLAHFSLTNQSREVTCDFDFASGAGDDSDGWSFDDRDYLYLDHDVDNYLHLDGVFLAIYFYFCARNFYDY